MNAVGRGQGRYSVVSLFSGCGGMDLGFTGNFRVFGREYPRLPFNIIWANDSNSAACSTYRRNLGVEIICADIQDVMKQVPERPDVVIGGFPCQDISINGRRKGSEGSESGLYKLMAQVIAECQPKVFVAENVKGLTQEYNKESLRQILSAFRVLGYTVTYQIYLAADFGVPQCRERVFIVGTAPGIKSFAPPAPDTIEEDWLTTKEAIGDLESLPENENINHIWSRAKASPDQGMRKLKANKPSDTIRAEHHGNIQFHYRLPRRISMREAARLQSFPDEFIFESGLRQIERQVGNAVPPVLAWHIAQATLTSLRGTEDQTASNLELTYQHALTRPVFA